MRRLGGMAGLVAALLLCCAASLAHAQCSYLNPDNGLYYDLSKLVVPPTEPGYEITSEGHRYWVNICAEVSGGQCSAGTAVCQGGLRDGSHYASCGTAATLRFSPYPDGGDGVVVDYEGGDMCHGAPRVSSVYIQCDRSRPRTEIVQEVEEPGCVYRFLMRSPFACGTAPTTATPTASPTFTPSPSSTPTSTPTWTPSSTPTASSTPTWTPSSTPTASSTPTWTPSSTPTWTPSSTPTWTPSSTPTWTPSSTPTASSTPTWTPSSTPTWTPSSTPTASSTPTWTPSSTPTWAPSSTPTASSTPTWTPSSTPTWTPSCTPTASSTPTWTPSSTPTWTPSSTPTASTTPTWTPSSTPTPTSTPTWTPSSTPTATASSEPTSTPSSSASSVPSASATPTPTPSGTPSSSPTSTPSSAPTATPVVPTATPTASPAPTPTATPSLPPGESCKYWDATTDTEYDLSGLKRSNGSYVYVDANMERRYYINFCGNAGGEAPCDPPNGMCMAASGGSYGCGSAANATLVSKDAARGAVKTKSTELGVILTYRHGSKCGSGPSAQLRMTSINVECDPTVDTVEITGVRETVACVYEVTARAASACGTGTIPSSAFESSGSSGGIPDWEWFVIGGVGALGVLLVLAGIALAAVWYVRSSRDRGNAVLRTPLVINTTDDVDVEKGW